MSHSPQLTVFTSIPTPYRIHQLTVLNQTLAEQGVTLEAWFMADSERGRYWAPSDSPLEFSSRRAKRLTISSLTDSALHINPGLFVETMRGKARWLLFGGTWYQPAPAMAMLFRDSSKYLLSWCESITPTHTRSVIEKFRSLILGKYDGFVVPGRLAGDYARRYSGKPLLHLPNFVDEHLYRGEVLRMRADRSSLRHRLGYSSSTRLFLWPARLHPNKGILEFLEAISRIPGDYAIVIAGDGPQKCSLQNYLTARGSTRVRLMGHVDQRALLSLYAVSDALLLPSLAEPFGFVTVEALWAGLPLLLSNRVGAAPEVLIDRSNGWLTDPTDPLKVAQTFSEVLQTSGEELEQMGERSSDIATTRFTSHTSARRFINQLLEAFPA